MINWDKDRFNRIKGYFILEDDRLSGGISVGEELRVFCKIPRALLRPFGGTNSGAAPGASTAAGSTVDTVTVVWSAKVWVFTVNKLSGLIEAVVTSSSHGKVRGFVSNCCLFILFLCMYCFLLKVHFPSLLVCLIRVFDVLCLQLADTCMCKHRGRYAHAEIHLRLFD